MLNRKSATIFILLSLLGLMIIQFRLLVIGVKLEKQRFDERVQIALEETRLALENDLELSDSIGYLVLPGSDLEKTLAFAQNSQTDDKLAALLQKMLLNKGISAQFTFAITNNYGAERFFMSEGFEEKSYQFDYYTIQLGNRITGVAHGERMLHLDISNLFNYLLGELGYLFIPSLLFLAILLICLWFILRLLRKEERLNEVKNDFINNLTHELKTPVFSISLAEKLLKQALAEGNTKKAKQFLQMIGNENERLKTHIEKVLELASLDSPKYQLNTAKVALNDVVISVVNDFKLKVAERNGHLKMELSKAAIFLNLDKVHFKNVIQNLLENALKYSPDLLEITIETKKEGAVNQLIIRDKGKGIASEFQTKIFDKFFRVPTENLHEVKGFGLGLHYVKKIVEAHAGTIEITSQKGKGTTFCIAIPDKR